MHDPKIIEAMARAIWGEDLGAGNADEVVSDGKANWQLCVTEANAALTALCTLHPDVAALLSGEAVAVQRGQLDMLILAAETSISRVRDIEEALQAQLSYAGRMLAASPWAQEEKRDAE